MTTVCKFILKNNDFDHIDDELINESLECNFPHYQHGEGCSSCPVYRQLLETKNPILEQDEAIRDEIEKWWT
jgi:hypothetical protein